MRAGGSLSVGSAREGRGARSKKKKMDDGERITVLSSSWPPIVVAGRMLGFNSRMAKEQQDHRNKDRKTREEVTEIATHNSSVKGVDYLIESSNSSSLPHFPFPIEYPVCHGL